MAGISTALLSTLFLTLLVNSCLVFATDSIRSDNHQPGKSASMDSSDKSTAKDETSRLSAATIYKFDPKGYLIFCLCMGKCLHVPYLSTKHSFSFKNIEFMSGR